MFRKILFWLHLICGVTVGLVVLMMSVTGVLLAYERQIQAWADRAHYADAAPGTMRQPLAALLAAAQRERPEFQPTAITLRNEPGAPVTFAAGRAGALLVDPYTAAVREPGPQGLREFFDAVEGWHRWINASGDSRATARMITGASNLVFLVLVLSGTYLWLPRAWKWAMFRARLAFNAQNTTSRARDFNWHHVFGIWSALPLAVVVATAVVFSFQWANALVYRSVGEQPPVRGGPPGGAPARGSARGAEPEIPNGSTPQPLTYDQLFTRAEAHGDWRTLTLALPAVNAARFTIDQGNGGQPQRRHTLTLDTATGDVQAWAPFSSQTPGQRLRSWIRFLHTGEALGIVGQTIAAIVSATSVIMVWTGLALAWRRLISPLFRRRGSDTAAAP
ncbi:MAG: PepSY-associated TM helix domain-containing protein [Gammaproteobacteria bacterium]